MNLVIRLAAPCLLAFTLVNCSTTDGTPLLGINQPTGTGPFCSRGNYVDDWADDPSKWRKDSPGRPSTAPAMLAGLDGIPVIATADQPPPSSIPIVASAPPPPRINSRTTTATVSKPAPKPATTTAARPAPKPTATAAAKPAPKPAAKPAPKTVAKPAPKTATRHVVKKGDTLSAIASRYGSSVSAIQRANKISGTLIHPGKSLVIPR
jgi:LysM repeat protein